MSHTLRAAMIRDRTVALMAERFPHDTAEAVLEAFSEIGDGDFRYFQKTLPLGAEKIGNALLNISFAYWERQAKAEAERQIAAQWDSCQCRGFGCRRCKEYEGKEDAFAD